MSTEKPRLFEILAKLADCYNEPVIVHLKTEEAPFGQGTIGYLSTAEFKPFKIVSNRGLSFEELTNELLEMHGIYSKDQSQEKQALDFSHLPLYEELKRIISPNQKYDTFKQLVQELNENDLKKISPHLVMHHPKNDGGKYIGSIYTNVRNSSLLQVFCDYQLE